MHSVKNTAIAMILLGVSFTLYHISLQPAEEAKPGENSGSLVDSYDLSQVPDSVSGGVNSKSRLSDDVSSSTKLEMPLDSSFSVPPLSAGQPSGVPTQEPKSIRPAPMNQPSSAFESRTSTPPPANDDLVIRQRSEGGRDEGLISALNHQSGIQPMGNLAASNQQRPPQASEGFPSSVEGDSDFLRGEKNLSGDPGSANSFLGGDALTSSRDGQLSSAANEFNSPGRDFAPPMSANPIGTTSLSDAQSNHQVSAGVQPIASGETEVGIFTGQHRSAEPGAMLENLTFSTVWQHVDQWVAAGEFRLALQALSRFYRDDTLTGPQRQRLIGWLDALAAKVIFSSEDHLEGRPYLTTASDTLESLADRWQVPMELIANINQETIGNQRQLVAGTRMKQISGPFQAELKLDARVITLFLDDLYAGRFAVTVGTSGEPRPGEFEVVLKSAGGYTWRDAEGRDYPPGTPENGYGPHWMGLSGSLCIHAVPDGTKEGHRGCIGLSNQDAADLFVILSEGSVLTIVR